MLITFSLLGLPIKKYKHAVKNRKKSYFYQGIIMNFLKKLEFHREKKLYLT